MHMSQLDIEPRPTTCEGDTPPFEVYPRWNEKCEKERKRRDLRSIFESKEYTNRAVYKEVVDVKKRKTDNANPMSITEDHCAFQTFRQSTYS